MDRKKKNVPIYSFGCPRTKDNGLPNKCYRAAKALTNRKTNYDTSPMLKQPYNPLFCGIEDGKNTFRLQEHHCLLEVLLSLYHDPGN